MRWNELFADLEARFDELAEAQALAEVAERERIEFGGIGLLARLAGALGGAVRLWSAGGTTVTGTLRRLGPDWALLDEAPGRQAVVALDGVTLVEGLRAATGPALDRVAGRLTLRAALRGLARDRAPVAVTVHGSQDAAGGTGTVITGTIDRVGADFVEVAVHPAWESRRASAVRSTVAVPLRAVAVVRAQPLG